MSQTPAGFILQVMALITGGGIVQLILALIRRRPEIRKIDAEVDSVALTSQNAYIDRLQAGEVLLRDEVAALKAEIAVMKDQRTAERLEWMNEREALRKEWDAERTANTEALESAARESTRVRRLLVQVRMDLAGALDEINDLKARVAAGPKPADPP